ncbi:MAG TPA: HAD-IB family hydrolase [Planctomycetota bacterium]
MSPRAAYCDVDGTLTATDIVMPLNWFKRQLSPFPSYAAWMASLLFRGPYWLLLDKLSRGASNREIYCNYAGMNTKQVKQLAAQCYTQCLRPRLRQIAVQRIEDLKREGFAIVLVTGGLDFIMRPLAEELGAELIAPALLEAGGVFTGALDREPLTGKHKADALRAHAQDRGIDLAESFAFGDAFGDLDMLECVGHPVAVSPGRRLENIARQRNWMIVNWREP